MAGIVFDLSSVEAKSRFHDLVVEHLDTYEVCDDTTMRLFRDKALEIGVHQLDFESIINEELDKRNQHAALGVFGISCPRCDTLIFKIVDECLICGWRFTYHIGEMSEESQNLEQWRISIARDLWRSHQKGDPNFEDLVDDQKGEPAVNEVWNWLVRDVEKAIPAAQNLLGEALINSYGVQEDKQEALKLFRKAASQNYARAHYNLGEMYKNGWGVSKDKDEAIKWYDSGARLGDDYSKEALEKIVAELKEAQEEAEDHALWERCASIGTKSAYQEYLREKPSGKHVGEAKTKLDAIISQEEELEERAAKIHSHQDENLLLNKSTIVYLIVTTINLLSYCLDSISRHINNYNKPIITIIISVILISIFFPPTKIFHNIKDALRMYKYIILIYLVPYAFVLGCSYDEMFNKYNIGVTRIFISDQIAITPIYCLIIYLVFEDKLKQRSKL